MAARFDGMMLFACVNVVVVGAGVAGIAAGLLLARDGHEVTLLDRDGRPDEPASDDPWAARPGCPQLNQGHAFLSRGRNLLEAHLPEVLDGLMKRGGNLTDGNLILPPEYHAPDLKSVAIRRPLIDRALMDVAAGSVAFRTATVDSLTGNGASAVPRVTGVRTSAGERLPADLVVDATGRRSRFPGLLAAIGAKPPVERRSPCGIVYYGRYYELVADPPPMFGPAAARGSIGHLAFGAFWQESRIIVVGLNAGTHDHDMRILREERAFEATSRAVRSLAPYIDESFARPASPILAMGALENVIRSYIRDGAPVASGFVAIGDALCHTDPVPAFGMSMALIQAVALRDMLRDEPDDPLPGFHEITSPELIERYEMVTAANAERAEHLQGRPPDPDTDHEWTLETGLALLGRNDPACVRLLLRRAFALDLPSVAYADPGLVDAARAAVVESGIADKVRHPTREELREILAGVA